MRPTLFLLSNAPIQKLCGFLRYMLVLIGCSSCTAHLTEQELDGDTFTQDTQGWHMTTSTLESLPKYSARGGNPGGYIYFIDNEAGLWYFAAPARLVNKLRYSYGQWLSFDLKQSATNNQVDYSDIILQSNQAKLTLKKAYHPGIHWTTYVIKLDESTPWKKNESSPVTQEDIQEVLANLTQLWIRGEFVAGPDQGGLDNVVIK